MKKHELIKQVLNRADKARGESDDFTYFNFLLYAGEALVKTMTLGIVAAIMDDSDRNRYRLEHKLVRSNGLGDWSGVLDDALIGPASQYLIQEARTEQTELIKRCERNDWQYKSVLKMKETLDTLEINADKVPNKSDLKRWIHLFSTLRNKTRGHGAQGSQNIGLAAESLSKSINTFYDNFNLFRRPWAYLHKNLSGKYRVSPLCSDTKSFDFLKQKNNYQFKNGIYIYFDKPKLVPLILSNSDLNDFFIVNGYFNEKNFFEYLSYNTGDKKNGDSCSYLSPPGPLPESETRGFKELEIREECFSNVPEAITNYIERENLEENLLNLLMDDRRAVVTLHGLGGIGKTSLALQVIKKLYKKNRYDGIIWFSARDIDLQHNKTKQVQPDVLTQNDMAKYYTNLLEKKMDNDVDCKKFFEKELEQSESFSKGCLFVFDNFETVHNPFEMFEWIDTYIRLPNKILITTRYKGFKGDYPLEVEGMTEAESRKLIERTTSDLNIDEGLLTAEVVSKIITQSKRHPYIIKILVGELKKNKNIQNILSRREDVLTALFERTYSSLSPCAQRVFMTLANWNSKVPKIALEAVLTCSLEQQEPGVVQEAIESLSDYSMAQEIKAKDGQEFIGLPVVAGHFGKKKIKISPLKSDIERDIKLLQLFGPTQGDDLSLNFAKQLDGFIRNISKRVDGDKESFKEYKQILNIICQVYNKGRLLLSELYIELEEMEKAKKELELFLETESGQDRKNGWKKLSEICFKTEDYKGYIHAIIERSKMDNEFFPELSNAANRLNNLFSNQRQEFSKEEKNKLASPLLSELDRKKRKAQADDFSRMAWLSISLDQDSQAMGYVNEGLDVDPNNYHCLNLKDKLCMAESTRSMRT